MKTPQELADDLALAASQGWAAPNIRHTMQAAAVVLRDQAKQLDRAKRRIVDLLATHRPEWDGDKKKIAIADLGLAESSRLYGDA